MNTTLYIWTSGLSILLIAILLAIYAKPLREGFYQVATPIEVSLNLNCVNTGSTVTCTADTKQPLMVESKPPPNPLQVPDQATRQALATRIECPMDATGVPAACRLQGYPSPDRSIRL